MLLEHRGPVLRLWKDTKRLGSEDRYLDLRRDALLPLLHAVHQDLVGFLVALHAWTRDIAAELADPLTDAVDRRLQLSSPLDASP